MSKPLKLSQVATHKFHMCLYMEEIVAGSEAKANPEVIIPPFSEIKNSEYSVIAAKYNIAGNFYPVSSRGRFPADYVQIVSEGSLTYKVEYSIDSINWNDLSTVISGSLSGGTPSVNKSAMLVLPNTPTGMNYKITVTAVTGSYYINLIN